MLLSETVKAMSSTTTTRIRLVDLETLRKVCDRKLWTKTTALRVAIEKLAAEVEKDEPECVLAGSAAGDGPAAR